MASIWYAIKNPKGEFLVLNIFPAEDGRDFKTKSMAIAESAAAEGLGTVVAYEHKGKRPPSYDKMATAAGTTWIDEEGRLL